MSWPVRSKQFGFYVSTPPANTFVSLGTVPAGKVWLIKDWSTYNGGAGVRDVFVMVKRGGQIMVLDAAKALASGNMIGNPNRHAVLIAGDEIGFQTSTALLFHFQISGAQLG